MNNPKSLKFKATHFGKSAFFSTDKININLKAAILTIAHNWVARGTCISPKQATLEAFW